MKRYVVSLEDDGSFYIAADVVAFHESGALLFLDGTDQLVRAFAAGEWREVGALK